MPCGASTGSPKPPPATVKRDFARVVDVTDGDTIRVRLNGKIQRVRLLGIDTPEVYTRTECGSASASASARKLLPVGARVLLVSDPSQDLRDRYGRLLRYVHRNGHDISEVQVQRGWAKVYVYAHHPFKRVAAYRIGAEQGQGRRPRRVGTLRWQVPPSRLTERPIRHEVRRCPLGPRVHPHGRTQRRRPDSSPRRRTQLVRAVRGAHQRRRQPRTVLLRLPRHRRDLGSQPAICSQTSSPGRSSSTPSPACSRSYFSYCSRTPADEPRRPPRRS